MFQNVRREEVNFDSYLWASPFDRYTVYMYVQTKLTYNVNVQFHRPVRVHILKIE